ncbi:hypothetical protein [Sporolactobacillus sp. KGMB 08714]|uniref:hypothetical protein n=1 Tax=Sporolactobacillus sp. KGMB 08714 TaxID=3064704 RepID=UPI002FBE0A52
MRAEEVAILCEKIVQLYPYLNINEQYPQTWAAVAKNADFQATMNRFHEYICDPKTRHQAPLPSDLLAFVERDSYADEVQKMGQWEAAATKNPIREEQLRQLFEKLGGDLDGTPAGRT